MHRIHRRKNEQIAKQFLCPQNCGKAYGSYAALYTHIKNKHPTAKPPQMKAGHIKVKQVVPKKTKQFEKERVVHQAEQHFDYDCKICRQKDCICFQDINGQQLDRSIALMGDQAFIKFVNCVGQLYIRDKFTWTRNTEETYQYLTKEMLRQMTYNFNSKYSGSNIVVFSSKWLQFLSLSSKYWDQLYIRQLYNAIIAIMSHENLKQTNEFFTTHQNQFKNVCKCIEAIPKEWAEFVELVKII